MPNQILQELFWTSRLLLRSRGQDFLGVLRRGTRHRPIVTVIPWRILEGRGANVLATTLRAIVWGWSRKWRWARRRGAYALLLQLCKELLESLFLFIRGIGT